MPNLQIREDLKTGGLKSKTMIADAKEVEGRNFVKQGTEKVKTHTAAFDTIKVVMKHDKPGRKIHLLVGSKILTTSPVKVSHVDNNTSYGLNS